MTELEKKAEAFANEVEAEIGHCCGDNLNISAAELAARLTPLLVEVCEQREKELREKIERYQRAGVCKLCTPDCCDGRCEVVNDARMRKELADEVERKALDCQKEKRLRYHFRKLARHIREKLPINSRQSIPWRDDYAAKLKAAELALQTIKAVRGQHDCGCEICSTVSAVCPASASSYALEIIQLKAALQAKEQELGQWKDAIIDAAVVDWVYTKEHETNPRKAINDLLAWNCKVALDPKVSKPAADLMAQARQQAIAETVGKVASILADAFKEPYCYEDDDLLMDALARIRSLTPPPALTKEK